MILPQPRHPAIAAVACVVAALAVVIWLSDPSRYATSLVAITTMACIWIVVAVSAGTPWDRAQAEGQRRFLVFAAVIGGSMLAVSLAIRLFAASDGIGPVAAERLGGIALGAMLTAFANRLPKIVGGFGSDRVSSARAQAVDRFVGWCFVLVGLATIALWTFAEVDRAADLSQATCAVALALVVARGAGGACVASRRDPP